MIFEITVDQNNKTKYTGVLHPLVNIFRIQIYTKTSQKTEQQKRAKTTGPRPQKPLKNPSI